MRVNSLDNSEEQAVSHNARIRKHVLIGNGEIAGVTNFSRAVFPAGEIAYQHTHKDMNEVFYIESGSAEMVVDGQILVLKEGMCITIEANETHELRNTGVTELVVLYFGVLNTAKRLKS